MEQSRGRTSVTGDRNHYQIQIKRLKTWWTTPVYSVDWDHSSSSEAEQFVSFRNLNNLKKNHAAVFCFEAVLATTKVVS